MKKQTCCPATFIVVGIIVAVIALVIQFAVVPAMFKSNLEIRNGSQQYKNWYKPEVPVYFQWYVFNLTNVAETLADNTVKPNFTQLGPYTYRESRVKTDIVWNDNGTVTYKNLKIYTFVPEKSNGSEEDVVFSVNLPLVTVAESFRYENRALQIGFTLLADHYNEKLYKNYTVHQLIWGYHDPMMHAAMSLFPDWFYTDFLGIYAGKNNTDDGVWTVDTGANNLTNVGQTELYNGTKYLNFWSTRYANMVNGSDGTIGPPGLTKDQTVYFFVPDVCRSLYTVYFGEEETTEGITLYRFSSPSAELKNATSNPDNAGFCTPAGNCPLGDGMMNLTTCQVLDHFNVPVIASLPHFLYADPRYSAKVDGMNPVEKKHRTDICIEPKTGIVMRVAKRLQINMYLQSVDFIAQMKGIQEMVFPVAWLDENAVIDKPTQNTFLSMMDLMNAASIICYVMYGIAAAMTLTATGFLVYFKQKSRSTGERQPLLSGVPVDTASAPIQDESD